MLVIFISCNVCLFDSSIVFIFISRLETFKDVYASTCKYLYNYRSKVKLTKLVAESKEVLLIGIRLINKIIPSSPKYKILGWWEEMPKSGMGACIVASEICVITGRMQELQCCNVKSIPITTQNRNCKLHTISHIPVVQFLTRGRKPSSYILLTCANGFCCV